MLEGHGDDAWKYNSPIKADFSSNVLHGPLDDRLLAHLRDMLPNVTHYPEAGARKLQKAAAKAYGVDEASVLATNGVTEAIYLIAQAFREREAVIYTPAFAEYADACAVQGMKISYRDWADLHTGKLPKNGLVFLCNPNNPTGWTVALKTFGEYPDALFVVDESYIEFAPGASSALNQNQGNVLVLRSLTKSCRIPGLRVGFVIGPEPLVTSLRDRKMPWSVNRLAIEAGLYIFEHPQDFKVPVERLRAETVAWQEELRATIGWKVWDTDTHYFLIGTPEPMKMKLLQEYGLLVRDASNFQNLGPNIIRVACGSPEHNGLLTKALGECARTGR